MPETTVVVWRNLWFHTGDRGKTDEDGFFYFVDRTKDMIRRRGENISSFEIERVMCAHDAVAEAAAYAVVSDGLEEVMVSVVLHDAAEPPDPDELVKFCGGNLPRFALPRFIRFVDALPRNALGKVQRDRLAPPTSR